MLSYNGTAPAFAGDMNKRIIVGFFITAAAFFSLGAWSRNDVLVEMGQRFLRDANNADWFGSDLYYTNSPEAYWYFFGRMEARYEDALLVMQMTQ